MTEPAAYAFGDYAIASERLGLLARTFAPTTCELLDALGARRWQWAM